MNKGRLYRFIIGEPPSAEIRERVRREREERQRRRSAEHRHIISKVVLVIGLLDLLVTASFLLGGAMTVEYGVSAAVRFGLFVVLPLLFINAPSTGSEVRLLPWACCEILGQDYLWEPSDIKGKI